MVPLSYYLVLSGILFSCGMVGFLIKRNIITIFMSIELMLNSVNISLIAFNAWFKDSAAVGQIFALFIITVAAAEVGVGLAIVLLVFRHRKTINVDEVDLLKW